MTEADTLSTRTEKHPETAEGSEKTPQAEEEVRQGRRFSVDSRRGQARARVRYIEGNHPAGGCRFLG